MPPHDLVTVIRWFPLVFLVHDAEEILTVQPWMQANHRRLRQRFGHRRVVAAILERMASITTARFATIVACLFVAACAASYLALTGDILWYTSALAVLTINVFTHAGQAVLTRGYTPGVVTAVAVVLPYSLYAWAGLFRAGMVGWPAVGLSLAAGLPGVVMIFLAGEWLGRRLFRG